MGRAQDFVVLVVVIFVTLTIQFVGGAMLEETRAAVSDNPDISQTQHQNLDNVFKAAVFWSPLIVQLGSVAIVAWREWRRQRVTQVSRRAF